MKVDLFWTNLLLALIFPALVTGCAAPVKERIVTQRVEVPIYQPCRPRIEPRPVYPTEIMPVAVDIHDQMKTALAELALRQAREMLLEAALSGCAAQ